MGWRIDYGLENKSAYQDSWKRRLIMTIGVLTAFCMMISFFWPEGREMLRLMLIPGNPDVTLEAAEVFAEQLQQGSSFEEAVTQFCRTVFQYDTVY